MGLYEGIKDVARIVQQADNIELYKTLLDLGAQALDMQEEIFLLQKQNEDLKIELNKKQSIIRHKGLFITLKDEFPEVAYCASCYGKDSNFIQMFDYDEERYRCPVCGIYAYKNE